MSEEWGPWIEHDGKGCPCVGQYCQRLHQGVHGGLVTAEGIAGRSPWNWDWSWFGKLAPNGLFATKVLRYRIRKPRGLTILEEVANGVREPVDA